jgi:hypothetical protein
VIADPICDQANVSAARGLVGGRFAPRSSSANVQRLEVSHPLDAFGLGPSHDCVIRPMTGCSHLINASMVYSTALGWGR